MDLKGIILAGGAGTRLHPTSGRSYDPLELVADRKRHYFRYAIDSRRIGHELGYRASVAFPDGIRSTIEWFLAHPTWWWAISRRLRGAS